MKLFFSMDAVLLCALERFCHGMQLRIGRTNLWLMGKVAVIQFIVFALALLQAVFNSDGRWLGQPPSWSLLAILGPFIVLKLYIGLFRWEEEETAAFARLRRGLSNPAKIDPVHRIIRFCFLIILVVSLMSLGHFSFVAIAKSAPTIFGPIVLIALLTAGAFLHACDPLPPATVTFWPEMESVAG